MGTTGTIRAASQALSIAELHCRQLGADDMLPLFDTLQRRLADRIPPPADYKPMTVTELAAKWCSR